MRPRGSASLEHGPDKGLGLAQQGIDLVNPGGAELRQDIALERFGPFGRLGRSPTARAEPFNEWAAFFQSRSDMAARN